MQFNVRGKTAVVNLNKDGSQNISFGRLSFNRIYQPKVDHQLRLAKLGE